MIKKRKIRCIERRKFKRLDFSIPVTVQLLGTTKYPKTIHAETKYSKQIIYEIDTTDRTVAETAKIVLDIIHGRYEGDIVNWSEDIATILTKDINKKLNG